MAKSKEISLTVNMLKKIFNHYIFKNLLILLIIGFFMFYGSLVILRHYTHHGEALSVPDVTGLTLKEAGTVLASHQLRWQLVDSVYVASVKPGAVVSQNPEPDFKVKENRNVFLTINAMTPEKVKMPDVVGVSLRQAKTLLESQGLSLGRMSYVPDIAVNNVLKQMYQGKDITKGVEVLKGSAIDLVLGQGLSDEKTSVPNLMGLTLKDAHDYLTKYSLNIGVIIYDSTVVASADSVKAFIWQQKPAADVDALLQLGASVDIWLTADENKNSNIIRAE
jgi:beta-lactam-binding protein with PASTA domain